MKKDVVKLLADTAARSGISHRDLARKVFGNDDRASITKVSSRLNSGETADQLEAAGRHDEAVAFASDAVEECPGNRDLLLWEERLVAGDHDPNFNCHKFIYGGYSGTKPDECKPTTQSEDTRTASSKPHANESRDD